LEMIMMPSIKSPLRPPWGKPDQPVRDQHPPSAIDRGKLPLLEPNTPGKVTPRPATERTHASEPEPRQQSAPQHARKPLRCRECGAKGDWPAAGWYELRRRILRGSVPPEVLNDTRRKAWARDVEQWMGTYCSLTCLERSMGRLKELDLTFREKGVGTALADQPRRREVPGAMV
jgi:hypothetical protein